jgi:hypothetical protein
MARKSGLGPQGRRTIDEARAGDGPSKGAFSEIPGRVESGQTKPTDTIPGYVTAAERPTTTPARGGLLGGTLGRGGPGGRLLPGGTRYTGPVSPNDVVPMPRSVSTSSSSPVMSSRVTGNTPSAANAGPGRSAPVGNAAYGGSGGGNPVISSTSTSGGGGNAGGGKGDSFIDMGLKIGKALVTPSPYAPLTWMERNMSAEGLSMLYGNGTGGSAPLYGYQTSRYHIEPKRKDPSDNFRTARRDPTIADPEPLSGQQQQQQINHQYQNSDNPPFRQGGSSNANQRLHRDRLHDINTGQGYAGTHADAIGNTWGDAHSRATSGVGAPENPFNVQSIRAPKPE